jgi:uncharacterized lipoprotein
MLKKLIILACAFSVMSCTHIYGDKGVIKNRDNDYLKAESIAPMQVPPGYNTSSMESNYPVSEKTYPANKTKVDLTPPGLNNSSN